MIECRGEGDRGVDVVSFCFEFFSFSFQTLSNTNEEVEIMKKMSELLIDLEKKNAERPEELKVVKELTTLLNDLESRLVSLLYYIISCFAF